MVQLYFVAALAATAAVTSALSTTPKAFNLKVEPMSLAGSTLGDLYMKEFHSGAGLNDIIAVPKKDSSKFHYNPQTQAVYKRINKKIFNEVFSLFLSHDLPHASYTPGGLRGFHEVTFNARGIRHHNPNELYFSKNGTLEIGNPPARFGKYGSLALCTVREVSGDEPKGYYDQLLWREPESDSGKHSCYDIKLRAM